MLDVWNAKHEIKGEKEEKLDPPFEARARSIADKSYSDLRSSQVASSHVTDFLRCSLAR